MIKGLKNNERSLTKEVKLITMKQVPTTDQLKAGELGADIDGQNLYMSNGMTVKKAARGAGAPPLSEVTAIGNKTSDSIISGTTNNYTTINNNGIVITKNGVPTFSISNEVVSGSTDTKDSFVDWLDINSNNNLGFYAPVNATYLKTVETELNSVMLAANPGATSWVPYPRLRLNVEVACTSTSSDGAYVDVVGTMQVDNMTLFTADKQYPQLSFDYEASYDIVMANTNGETRTKTLTGVPANTPIDFDQVLIASDWGQPWAFFITFTVKMVGGDPGVTYKGFLANGGASQPLPTTPTIGDRYCVSNQSGDYVIAEWDGTSWVYTDIIDGGMFVNKSTYDINILKSGNIITK